MQHDSNGNGIRPAGWSWSRVGESMPLSGPARTDVVIIGGGPAGLAAALALNCRGIDCLVVDRNEPPIDKACGEGLMPDSLQALAGLGVNIPLESGGPFRGIRFLDDHKEVSSLFPNGEGLGVRRTRLHQLMADRAQDAGIKLLWGWTAAIQDEQTILLRKNSIGNTISTRFIIGADGQTSQVRRRMHMNRGQKLETRYGFRQHFQIEPWTDHVEVHWGRCSQIYVTPTGPAEVGLALCTRDPSFRLKNALEEFSILGKRLRNCKTLSSERGAVTTTRKLLRVTSGNAALLGDASGSVDAVTGEGLAVSFRQAIALADAISTDRLWQYEKAHREILRLPHVMAATLLLLDRYPAVRQRAFAVLSRTPESFERMLSAHVGHEPLWQVVVSQAPVFGWRWLTA